ncbi:MAG: hypothetical protein K8L97_12375 [Anaerolineae bacterium]|nr:hypothetical protein [Anaerolineae bacterium]
MFFFGLRKPKIHGLIGYYKLQDWYLSAFTDEERKYVESKYRPFGGGAEGVGELEGTLTERKITSVSSPSSSMFLSGLSSFLKDNSSLALRVLEKAEKEAIRKNDVNGLHFTYRWMIEFYYHDRDKISGALDKAIDACKCQIAIAPKVAKEWKKEFPNRPLPQHTGFNQLAIILEKQKDYKEAIKLSKDAYKQGWSGDWLKRIERCEEKLKSNK